MRKISFLKIAMMLSCVNLMVPIIGFADGEKIINSEISDSIQIVAQGVGLDADSALRNAYSNAIQQALGLYVDASTLVQNDQIIKDQVLTHSRGLIQEVTTVSQGIENGLMTVSIRATIKKQPLVDHITPVIKTSARIDGSSLHAEVATTENQKKNALELIESAVTTLKSPSAFKFEIFGDPDYDKNSNKLKIKVKVIPDIDAFRLASKDLTEILDQVSVEKRDISPEYTNDNMINYYSLLNPPPGKSKPEGAIYFSVFKWANKSNSQSLWVRYLIPVKEIKFDDISSSLTVNILSESGNLLGFSTVDLNQLAKVRSIHCNDGYMKACAVGPYVLYHNSYLKNEFDFIVEIPLQASELAEVKSAEINVSY